MFIPERFLELRLYLIVVKIVNFDIHVDCLPSTMKPLFSAGRSPAPSRFAGDVEGGFGFLVLQVLSSQHDC